MVNLIHFARKEKRLTLRDVSRMTGMSIGYLCDIEHGRKSLPKNTQKTQDLCTILGISDPLPLFAQDLKAKTKRKMKRILAGVPQEMARKIQDEIYEGVR